MLFTATLLSILLHVTSTYIPTKAYIIYSIWLNNSNQLNYIQMEFIFSANKMKQLMETADDTIKTFVSTPRDKEIVDGIKIMESMNVRTVEVDLSEDDCQLLH